MSRGSLSIDSILERFSRGLGVSFSKEYTLHGKTSRNEQIEVYLFPQKLCKPDSSGLIIIAGRGHFVWDGTYKLSGIKLLGKNIHPIELANDIAYIANAMSERVTELVMQPEAMLAIEAPR